MLIPLKPRPKRAMAPPLGTSAAEVVGAKPAQVHHEHASADSKTLATWKKSPSRNGWIQTFFLAPKSRKERCHQSNWSGACEDLALLAKSAAGLGIPERLQADGAALQQLGLLSDGLSQLLVASWKDDVTISIWPWVKIQIPPVNIPIQPLNSRLKWVQNIGSKMAGKFTYQPKWDPPKPF